MNELYIGAFTWDYLLKEVEVEVFVYKTSNDLAWHGQPCQAASAAAASIAAPVKKMPQQKRFYTFPVFHALKKKVDICAPNNY